MFVKKHYEKMMIDEKMFVMFTHLRLCIIPQRDMRIKVHTTLLCLLFESYVTQDHVVIKIYGPGILPAIPKFDIHTRRCKVVYRSIKTFCQCLLVQVGVDAGVATLRLSGD